MRIRQILGRALALLLLGVVSWGASPQQARAGEGPEINQDTTSPAADQDLARAIQMDLIDAEFADLDAVVAEVRNGIVTLTGKVESDHARDEAMRIARTYEEVEVVLDRMSMPPQPARTDEQIETGVLQMMQKHSTFDLDQVDVEAENGTVTLTGLTDTYRDRSLAGELTGCVEGVSHVENHIEVVRPVGAANPDDQQIRQEIQGSLIRLFGPEAADVDVDVDNGRVELDGTVPTSEVREDLIDMAWVLGVTEIDDDDLKIDLEEGYAAPGYGTAAAAGAAASDVQHAAYRPGDVDADLQRNLSQAFDEEPALDRMEPEVQVDDGVVYLTGEVESEAARRRAEEIALATPGVVLVENRLTVSGESLAEYLSDDAIQRRVEGDLYDNPLFERNMMYVDVDDGVVRLSGWVASGREKAIAEDIASSVVGVKDVRNDLAVSHFP
ncbi:MAG: BON domain-containing protein [Candidatus Polarisedimenticolia bacterium]